MAKNAYVFSSWNKIFELNRKGHEPSQVKLWLEPVRLGLITGRYILKFITHKQNEFALSYFDPKVTL